MCISNKLAEYEMKIQVFTDCQAHYMLNTEVYKDKAIAEGEKLSGSSGKFFIYWNQQTYWSKYYKLIGILFLNG